VYFGGHLMSLNTHARKDEEYYAYSFKCRVKPEGEGIIKIRACARP
jgi:hypothetical protein